MVTETLQLTIPAGRLLLILPLPPTTLMQARRVQTHTIKP
jgi:hypothetical protein